ncbi:amidohydrolase [Oleomonas cavernae]|uniref:Amidohydrolase n=1 Tax=Oleomonas cavernae TaxID=2320859 RepID=A0A418WJ04_9PROT|nr:amidohydrolase family protein [Oleomonas cavernae]RJF90027.1 amidohydrolase [Oleomonas cavernae]
MDRYLVISGDGHAGLPPEGYRDYLEAKYHAEFDERLPKEIAFRAMMEEKLLVREFNENWRAACGNDIYGVWDSVIRDKVLDGDGVAAEVLFPDGITERNAPPFGADVGLRCLGADPELLWAGAHAHNRWMVDFVAMSPLRRIGLAVIPVVFDIDKAVAEIKWAHKSGLKGVMFPCMTDGFDPYNHPKYDPVWAVCEDLNMGIHFHSGAAPPMAPVPGAIGTFLMEYPFWMTRSMWQMIFGEVFERFPRLKVIYTEGSEFWFTWMIKMMDIRASVKHTSGKLGDFRAKLTMPPSGYFNRNMWVVASALADRDTTIACQELGLSRVIWGSDYPHPEGCWPKTQAKMLDSLGGLPEADLEQIFWKSAADVYDLDLPALNKIAAKIGPQKQWLATRQAAE